MEETIDKHKALEYAVSSWSTQRKEAFICTVVGIMYQNELCGNTLDDWNPDRLDMIADMITHNEIHPSQL